MAAEQLANLIPIAEEILAAGELAASLVVPGSGAIVASIDRAVRALFAYIEANSRSLTDAEREVQNEITRTWLARLEALPADGDA